jgi:hypothetical protein
MGDNIDTLLPDFRIIMGESRTLGHIVDFTCPYNLAPSHLTTATNGPDAVVCKAAEEK